MLTLYRLVLSNRKGYTVYSLIYIYGQRYYDAFIHDETSIGSLFAPVFAPLIGAIAAL